MKRLGKSILIFILSVSFIIAMCFNSSAYVLFGHKMIGEIGQSGRNTRYYWYDADNFSSTWELRVEHAMDAWCTTGSKGCGTYTSAYILKTTTKSKSVIDFYKMALPGNECVGQTLHYYGSGIFDSSKILPEMQNWTWCEIDVDAVKMNNMQLNGSAMSATQKRVSIEHEIGHAFGLDDNSSVHVSSVMHQLKTRTVTQPSADDCYGINSIYGGYNP